MYVGLYMFTSNLSRQRVDHDITANIATALF